MVFKSADQLIASHDLKRKLYCSSLRCYLLRKSLFQESRYVLPRMEMATIHLNCQVDYFNFLIPWFCCSCCYNLVIWTKYNEQHLLSLMDWVWNKWSVSIRLISQATSLVLKCLIFTKPCLHLGILVVWYFKLDHLTVN